MKLFSFKGGVKPAPNKSVTTAQPIIQSPLVSRYYIPLSQGVGDPPRLMVKAGQQVAKGERLAQPLAPLSIAIHAPTSGTIIDVCDHVSAHPSGLSSPTVVLEADGQDRWLPHEPIKVSAHTPESLREILRNFGLVGLGGAVFPSHIKLKPVQPVHTLILNGGECEPYITCDDLIMRERAEGILRGATHMATMLGANRILVGIENNKPEALEAMKFANEALRLGAEIIAVPTVYPAGGAAQLIRTLTGVKVPHGRRSYEFGVQCFNVATAYQVHRAFDHGEPSLSRVLTIAGAVRSGANFEARIGTPLSALVAAAEPLPDVRNYLVGGPMMGFVLPSLDAPLTKVVNCLLAVNTQVAAPAKPEQPCIRCNRCADVCPHVLQPFELYWYARGRDFGKTQQYDLFDCIECGCCSYVCPSNIPLVDYFRFAKSEIWARERQTQESHNAKERFELRQERLTRLKNEREAKLAERTAAGRAALSASAAEEKQKKIREATARARSVAPVLSVEEKKTLIAAALQRVLEQKAGILPANTSNLTPEQAMEIARVDQHRASLIRTIAEIRQQEAVDDSP